MPFYDFSAHLVGLPWECHTEEVGRRLCTVVDSISEVQVLQYERPKLKFFLIYFSLDLSKPIWCVVILNLPFYGLVKCSRYYKRLRNFCFHCGFLDHSVCNCPLLGGRYSSGTKTRI